jgi:hypothetical protein
MLERRSHKVKVLLGSIPIKVQDNQIRNVEKPSFFVANRPRRCATNSENPYLVLPYVDLMGPHASSCSKVSEQGLLYWVAME